MQLIVRVALTTLALVLMCVLRADPRLLGALRKTVSTGEGRGRGLNETHLSVFHSALNCARGKRSRNSISSAARYAFNSFVFIMTKRLFDIHVT